MNRCRSCACTDGAGCPGGCFWAEPDLCSRCANVPAGRRDAEFLEQTVMLELPLGLLMALHGYLCLALRHPGTTGPSRALVEALVQETEEVLEEAGVLTADEVAAIRRDEAAAAPRIVLAR